MDSGSLTDTTTAAALETRYRAALNRLTLVPAIAWVSLTVGLPLVAVTSFAGLEQQRKALAAGFRGFIEKPIDIERFPEQVAEYAQPSLL